MKLRRVKLENYRNHSTNEFHFTRGINLLLGPNGSGKTSILEAVSLALFNMSPRDTRQAAVQNGAAGATIEVEFEATDENIYLVEQKIGRAPRIQLYRQGKKSSLASGREEVQQRVNELTGIPHNAARIYESVIIARQNQLTDIFNQTPTERESDFNTIFNTEIYRNIYEHYSLKSRQQYKDEQNRKQSRYATLTEQVSDSSEIDEQLNTENARLKELEKEQKKLNQAIDSKDTRLTALKEKRHEYRQLLDKSKSLSGFLQEKQNRQTELQEELQHAREAKRICEKTEPVYNKYLEDSEKLHSLSNEITNLESQQQKYYDNEARISHFREELTAADTGLNGLEEQSQEKETQLEKIRNEQEDILDSLDKAREELEREHDALDKLTTVQENLFQYLDEYRNTKEESTAAKISVDNKQQELENGSNLEAEHKAVSEKLETLAKQMEELEKHKAAAAILETRLQELNKASDELSAGTCPFLEEECLNLQQGQSPESYIKKRSLEINAELDNHKAALKQLASIPEEHSTANNRLSVLDNQCEEQKNIKNELKVARQRASDVSTALNELETRIKKAAAIESFEPSTDDTPESVTEKFRQLSSDKEIACNSLTNRTRQIEEKASELKEESERIQNQLTMNLQTQKEHLKNKDRLHSQLAEAAETAKALEKKLEPLAEYRTQRQALEQDMSKNRDTYQQYLENREAASGIDRLQQNLDEIVKSSAELEQEIDRTKNKAEDLEEDFNEEDIQKLEEALSSLREDAGQNFTQTGSCEATILSLNEQLDKNRQIQQECRDLKTGLQLLDSKITLLDEFRTNINGMGQHVASHYLVRIENLATQNFQRLTGRSERILWRNDENPYTVYLASPDDSNRRTFNQLSGGEQVAAALSLRAALTNFFTNSGLAVFDEPTVNLDAPRREALASCLQDLLKDLNQAIIVSHDDVFQEMAQNIVYL